MIRLDDQVVLVTGAGRGLGAAYAQALAACGGTVVVHDAGVDRDGSGGDPAVATAVAEQITAAGERASAETQDLASREGCEDLVASVLDRHGRIDALVHNAGLVRYHGILDTPDRDWERMLAVNVTAPWWLCRAAWPVMAEQRYGRIVLTTSGFALRAIPGADVTAYSTGKGAQFGLMNALAAEGEPLGIRVKAISQIAATRIFRRPTEPGELTPEAVAPGVVALASPDCPCTGNVLVAAGGTWSIDAVSRSEEVALGPDAAPEEVLHLIEAQLPNLPTL